MDIDIDDLSDSQVERELCDKQYDVVLTGSIVTHYKWIKWLSRVVRRINQDALIVVGNSVAGSIPEIFLKNSEVTTFHQVHKKHGMIVEIYSNQTVQR